MIIFTCGSKDNTEFDKALDKFSKFIIPKMNILYIPFAKENDEYERSFSEIIKHLGVLNYALVDMPKNAQEMKNKDIKEYSAIIIEDGNPFKLIDELEQAKEVIYKAVNNNTPLFAIGAGAVVLGNNIEQSEINNKCDDDNTDIKGLNLFDGRDIFIYTDKYKTDIYYEESQKLKYASAVKNRRILAYQKDTVIYKVNKGIYKLNKDYPFDMILNDKIYTCPFYGKIKYEITFNR